MAASKVTKSSVVSLKLRAGQTEAGNDIIKSLALPAVVASPDLDDVVAVKNAAAQCLAYPVARIEHTYTAIINEA